MFKNYLLINVTLGIILAGFVIMTVLNLGSPTEEMLEVPTIQQVVTLTETDSVTDNQVPTPLIGDDRFDQIYTKNLFHPERILPPTPTPEIKDRVPDTPTPLPLDCGNTGVTLSGIVNIENEKPYCFLKYAKDTGSDLIVYYQNDKIGDFTVTKIDEDSVTIAAMDGKSCEISLFDFSKDTMDKKNADNQRVRPTPPPRPTPARNERVRPTPRRHGVSQ